MVRSDPLHNPQYSQFCYTFQYMPGSTTYLDTPVVPVAAFAGPDQNPLDCEYVDATPRINRWYGRCRRRPLHGRGQRWLTIDMAIVISRWAYSPSSQYRLMTASVTLTQTVTRTMVSVPPTQ